MIAAEGLAAVGKMIATYRTGGAFATDYEIAWVTVALRDLRVRDDAGPGWIPYTGPRTCGSKARMDGVRNQATAA